MAWTGMKYSKAVTTAKGKKMESYHILQPCKGEEEEEEEDEEEEDEEEEDEEEEKEESFLLFLYQGLKVLPLGLKNDEFLSNFGNKQGKVALAASMIECISS
eukprot:gene5110-230_t